MRRGRPKHSDILTPREWQVLELLRQGLTNEEIAGRLSISVGYFGYVNWDQIVAWWQPSQ